MAYRKIYADVGNSFLRKEGFIRKKAWFYLYLPDEQLLKSVSFRTLYESREFELYFGIDSFVGGMYLFDDWFYTIPFHHISLTNVVACKHHASDDNFRYPDEEFRNDLAGAFESFMAEIYPEFSAVHDVPSLLRFREKHDPLLFCCAEAFYEYLQVHDYNAALEIGQYIQSVQEKNLAHYGGCTPEFIQKVREAGIEHSHVVETYYATRFWQNIVRCIQEGDTARLDKIIQRRIQNEKKRSDAFFQ